MSVISELNSSYTDEVFSKFNKELMAAGITKREIKEITLPSVNNEVLLLLMNEPINLEFNSDGELYLKDSDGSKLYVDPDDNEFDKIADRILAKLPDCPFDVECGGIKSCQIESVSMYKVYVMNSILEREYKEDIEEILKDYDLKNLKSSDGELSFTLLFKDIMENATPVMNLIVTCLNAKLTSFKAKKDVSYTGILSESDTRSLDGLVKQISAINYRRNEFNFTTRDTLKRLEKRLVFDAEKDSVIKKAGDRMNILYSIYSFTIDVVPSIKGVKIKRKARAIVNKMRLDEKILTDDDYDVFLKSLIRRAKRQVLREIKEDKYKLFSQGMFEGLIPKV
jgi:hypothetical protein